MKFNEWITQNKEEEFSGLTNNNVELQTQTDDNLIENQLDQWVNKIMGLLHNVNPNKKQKLLEKVITDIQARID